MNRGEIWWANLRAPRGSEPGYKRPVLIIQGNEFNRSLIRTVVAVILTSNINLQNAPGNVLLPARSARLPKDSVVNVSQIVTLDKSFLYERVSSLNREKMREVDEGLRLVLNL